MPFELPTTYSHNASLIIKLWSSILWNLTPRVCSDFLENNSIFKETIIIQWLNIKSSFGLPSFSSSIYNIIVKFFLQYITCHFSIYSNFINHFLQLMYISCRIFIFCWFIISIWCLQYFVSYFRYFLSVHCELISHCWFFL